MSQCWAFNNDQKEYFKMPNQDLGKLFPVFVDDIFINSLFKILKLEN